jgi:AraC-like DNA-binding protein
VLYPTQLPTFHRQLVFGEFAQWVRWFWIPEWDIEPGRTSRQHILAFPACNLVVEPAMVGLSGPTTRAGFRDLAGRSWAVGALLRPAAAPILASDVAALVDTHRQLDHPDLQASVSAAMSADSSPDERHRVVIAAVSAWLADRLGEPTPEGLLANRMEHMAETNTELLTVTDLADDLHVSVRTLQRLSMKYIGLPPLALIRRRRLQEAAERLREDPGLSIADLAAELGYADHAHLTRDFQSTLGFTPSIYRSSAGPEA